MKIALPSDWLDTGEALWPVESVIDDDSVISSEPSSQEIFPDLDVFNQDIFISDTKISPSQPIKMASTSEWIVFAQAFFQVLVTDRLGISDIGKRWATFRHWLADGRYGARMIFHAYFSPTSTSMLISPTPPSLTPQFTPAAHKLPAPKLRVIQGGGLSSSSSVTAEAMAVCEEAVAAGSSGSMEVTTTMRAAETMTSGQLQVVRTAAPVTRAAPILGIATFIRGTLVGAVIFEGSKAIGSLPTYKPISEQVCRMSEFDRKKIMEEAMLYDFSQQCWIEE